MRFIWVDLKRALTEPTFFASLGISSSCVLLGLVYCLLGGEYISGETVFKTSQSLILPFVAPLIAALPYSNMNMLEKDCGYRGYLLAHGGGKDYSYRRWFTASLVGGLTLVFPLIVLAIGCFFISPFENPRVIIEVIGLDFLFGWSYGSVAYGLTFVNRKRYIPIVAPQVLYLLFIYAFPYLSLEKYYPPLAFSPWILKNTFYMEAALQQLMGITIIGVLLILCGQVIRRLGYE